MANLIKDTNGIKTHKVIIKTYTLHLPIYVNINPGATPTIKSASPQITLPAH
jgi:hypothetical protein